MKSKKVSPKTKKAIAIKIAIKPVKVNPNMGALPMPMMGNTSPVGKAKGKKANASSMIARMNALRAKKKKK